MTVERHDWNILEKHLVRKIETLIVLVTSTHLHLVLALGFHKVVTMCSLDCGPESGAIIFFLDELFFFRHHFPEKKPK